MAKPRCSTPPKRRPPPAFTSFFEAVPDPRRVQANVAHPLLTVIAVVFVGVLCGAEGWDEIVLFAEGKQAWLSSWLDLRNGVPSADTLRRVFQRLDPKAFGEGMRGWMLSIAGALKNKVIAIDGKTLRGVGQRADVPLHLVHVWAVGARVLLASGASEGAPSEPEVTRQLLDLLKLEGAIITMDANGCCRESMATIKERGGEWVCALKGNRGALYDKVHTCFEEIEASEKLDDLTQQWAEADAAHGREEARRVFAIKAEAAGLGDEALPGLSSLVMIQRARLAGGSVSVERQYYVSSLPAQARKLAKVIRAHWGVENGLHWILDVQMREDDCAVHDRVAAENLALVRRAALSILKRDTKVKHGVKLKSSRASCDNGYIEHLLWSENP